MGVCHKQCPDYVASVRYATYGLYAQSGGSGLVEFITSDYRFATRASSCYIPCTSRGGQFWAVA